MYIVHTFFVIEQFTFGNKLLLLSSYIVVPLTVGEKESKEYRKWALIKKNYDCHTVWKLFFKNVLCNK